LTTFIMRNKLAFVFAVGLTDTDVGG